MISAWHVVIPTNLAQTFRADAMINGGCGEPQERVCLQDTGLLQARVLLAGVDGGTSGVRMIFQLH